MVDAYLKVLDLGFYEVTFAFEGLADDNVWRRPGRGRQRGHPGRCPD